MKYLLIILFATGLNCRAQEIQNVLDLEFYLTSEVESWYNQNYDKKIKSNNWILGDILSNPSASSKKIGQLITYYEPTVNNYILQFLSIDGKVTKEIRSWRLGIWHTSKRN